MQQKLIGYTFIKKCWTVTAWKWAMWRTTETRYLVVCLPLSTIL